MEDADIRKLIRDLFSLFQLRLYLLHQFTISFCFYILKNFRLGF